MSKRRTKTISGVKKVNKLVENVFEPVLVEGQQTKYRKVMYSPMYEAFYVRSDATKYFLTSATQYPERTVFRGTESLLAA